MTIPKFIDTHTHVNFRAFRDDADEVIRRALDGGVWMVNVGTQFETSRRAVELCENYAEGVYAAVGLHPIHLFSHHVDEEETSFEAADEEFSAGSYHELVLRSTSVVAIGEFGLDYFRMPSGEDINAIKSKQRLVVLEHIELAKSVDKPLMLHVRPSPGTMDAYEDLLKILDEQGSEDSPPREEGVGEVMDKDNPLFFSPSRGGEKKLEGVIHSFTGDFATAAKFLERGFYIGFNGIITFDKTGRSEEVVKNTPLDRIVLETDAPYLTPVPHRGHRNEPSYVKHVAARVAEFKGLDTDQVADATSANAKRLFRI